MHEALARKNFERDTRIVTPRYCALNGWVLNATAYPLLDVTIEAKTPIRFQFACDDWDEIPPSVRVRTPDGARWEGQFPGGIFNGGPHPSTGEVFICMRGAREFHIHPSHTNETWASYRGQEGMNLAGIMTQLSHAWRKQMGA